MATLRNFYEDQSRFSNIFAERDWPIFRVFLLTRTNWRFFVFAIFLTKYFVFSNFFIMARKDILILFDVDGTLTGSRLPIKPEMASFLENKLKPEFTVGLVGGSDINKIAEQVADSDLETLINSYDYVFSENGLLAYKNGKLITKESILSFLGESKCQEVINFSLEYLSKVVSPVKRGHFVEFRTGMINISPPGRSVSIDERKAFFEYDKKEKIREKMVQDLTLKFGDEIKFSLGGQISIDAFPIGWDKRYCLKQVTEVDKFKEIHFFGDKTSPGGNDHEIYEDSRTIGHSVTSPEDTIKQLKEAFNL